VAIAHGKAAASPREEVEEIRRIAAFCSFDGARLPPLELVPFNHLVTLAQVTRSDEELLKALDRSNYAVSKDPQDGSRLHKRAQLARRFLERWVPEEDRFTLKATLREVPLEKMGGPLRAYLDTLARALEKAEWAPEPLHAAVFGAAKDSGIEGKDGFRAVYLALIGKERGPRAGYFLASLDRTFVVNRFREVALAKP
jgi:lysyl-tRNA synthetase class 1